MGIISFTYPVLSKMCRYCTYNDLPVEYPVLRDDRVAEDGPGEIVAVRVERGPTTSDVGTAGMA